MRIKSSVVIAKLLDSDGFNDHVQNIVEKYWLNKICNPGGRKKHRRLERDITEMCTKLTDGEKLVLGKFISMHKAMAFQTGLRIGITAFACKNCREYEVEDDARRKPEPKLDDPEAWRGICDEPANAAVATERVTDAVSSPTEGRLPGETPDSGQTS